MPRPVIGIIGNTHLINETYQIYGVGGMTVEAVSQVCDALPLMVPTDPEVLCMQRLTETCDGFIFTGGRPNVHPDEYGHEPSEAHGDFDRARDRVALDLIRKCVETGQPIFGICRGFQEVAVAFGSTLHPEIRDLPGRDNHRMPPDGTLEEKFALRHVVTVSENGPFSKVFGSTQVLTNTLHGQGIEEAGSRVVIDGHAPDGTPEAIYIEGAPGYTLSVQWHPEYNAANDPVSLALFGAFGQACQDWADGKLPKVLKTA